MSRWWTAGQLDRSPEAEALRRLERVIDRIPRVWQQRHVAGDTAIIESDGLILVDSTAAARTLTLPDASLVLGRRFTVKLWTGANNVVVQGSGGQQVDGAANKTWNTAKAAFTFQASVTALPATYGWAIV